MKEKSFKMVVIIWIAIIIVMAGLVTYAYVVIKMNGAAADAKVTTARIGDITYTAENINTGNEVIYPGWESTAKSVEVELTASDKTVDYVCTLSFTSRVEDLYLKVENVTGTNANSAYANYAKVNGNSVVLSSGTLTGNQTDEINYYIMFKETNTDQSLQMGIDIIGNVTCDLAKYQVATPELYNGLLTPVIYDGQNWRVTDVNGNWYDYEKQMWANAVILRSDVTKVVGDTVSVDGNNPEALAMYVWVPRYEYNMSDAAAASPKEIRVNFISKNTITPTEGYAINSGFTFGETNLSGIWVGKFETSHATSSTGSLGCTNESCTNADNLRILPNVQSLGNNNVSKYFYASRSMGRSGNPFGIDPLKTDSHMMKNSEWGIVAYLSQSKYGKYGNSEFEGVNKEVYINNSQYYTGRSGGAPAGNTPINTTYTDQTSTGQYNTYGFYTYDGYLLSYGTNNKTTIRNLNNGTGASTTGNIYGIYDMSGGSWEYVMGNYNGTISSSGFASLPNQKYYDKYTSTTANQACNGGICYGHAVSPEVANWYQDYSPFVSSSNPWFGRGGAYTSGAYAGVVSRYYSNGVAAGTSSFRLVLSEA